MVEKIKTHFSDSAYLLRMDDAITYGSKVSFCHCYGDEDERRRTVCYALNAAFAHKAFIYSLIVCIKSRFDTANFWQIQHCIKSTIPYG